MTKKYEEKRMIIGVKNGLASIREHASTAIFLRAGAEKKFALRARGSLESTTREQ